MCSPIPCAAEPSAPHPRSLLSERGPRRMDGWMDGRGCVLRLTDLLLQPTPLQMVFHVFGETSFARALHCDGLVQSWRRSWSRLRLRLDEPLPFFVPHFACRSAGIRRLRRGSPRGHSRPSRYRFFFRLRCRARPSHAEQQPVAEHRSKRRSAPLRATGGDSRARRRCAGRLDVRRSGRPRLNHLASRIGILAGKGHGLARERLDRARALRRHPWPCWRSKSRCMRSRQPPSSSRSAEQTKLPLLRKHVPFFC
jgi:hypothetical protein